MKYPKKPKDLADDLESFIYVLLFCALRYHRHTKSPMGAEQLKHAPTEKQIAANKRNDGLAIARHMVFYEERNHGDGLCSGGEYKLEKIKSGVPPITFSGSMVGTPLDVLLQQAYIILQQHYETVNYDELKKYLPDPSESPTPSPRVGRQSQATATRQAIDLSRRFGRRKMTTHDTPRTPTRASKSPPTSQRSTSSTGTSVNGRPLDTHTVLLDLFQMLLMAEDGLSIDVAPYRDDKLFDQFAGNSVGAEAEPAHDSRETEQSGKSSKRKERGSDESESPRPTKSRQLWTQNHGYQVNFNKR